MQLVSTKNCDNNGKCFTQQISAPIFIENELCNVEWKRSKYIARNGTWRSVKDDQKYFKIVNNGSDQIKVQVL